MVSTATRIRVRLLGMLAVAILAARCSDAPTQPPEPTPVPEPTPTPAPVSGSAGAWVGNANRIDGSQCPVVADIQEPDADFDLSGRIEGACFFSVFEAKFVGSSGRFEGIAHYSLVTDDYCGYQATLTGRVEGSPPTRITASIGTFHCATQAPVSGAQLALTRSR